MKIRTAIYGVYVAASAAGLAVLMGFILREVRLRHIDAMRRTLADTAALLATLLESNPDVMSGRRDFGDAARENLPALSRAAGTLRVYVTDARGVVLFDGNAGRDIGRDYTAQSEGLAPFDLAEDGKGSASIADGELRVAVPVHQSGNVLGYVGVARPFSTIAEAVLRARLRLVFGALVIAAIMTSAGWWIASKLTHSLERLTQYALRVRDGHRETPPQSRADEIAALSRAFEEMRVSLEGKAHVERYTQALAHELKAPLSAIRGAAELLGEEMPREERAKFLANLRAESERMQRVVDRLLELSALEAREAGTNFAVLDLEAVVEEVVTRTRPLAAARRVEVLVEAAVSPRVRGEASLLTEAVANLLHNAIEFSSPGGTVHVRLSSDRGHAVLYVDDDGPGVPAYALEKIFDRFYSLPRPDTGRKSSGLGLSIVREIARLHGGDVTLQNRPAGGARAALSLQLA